MNDIEKLEKILETLEAAKALDADETLMTWTFHTGLNTLIFKTNHELILKLAENIEAITTEAA